MESEEIWKDAYIEFCGWQEKSERQVHFTMVTSKSALVTFYGNLCHKLATFRLPTGILVKIKIAGKKIKHWFLKQKATERFLKI